MDKAKPARDASRPKNIIESFQGKLYDSICLSLLEKDKLVFSFLITNRILISENKITFTEIRFMMVGGTWTESKLPKPAGCDDWMTDKQWFTICEVGETIPKFKGLAEDFPAYINEF